LFVDRRADTSSSNYNGDLLMQSIKSKNLDLIKYVLDLGFEPEEIAADGGVLAVAQHKYDERTKDVCRLLIDYGAAVDGSASEKYEGDAEGCLTGAPYFTPLITAAKSGNTDVVDLLIAAGAPVNEVDYRSETAFLLAAQHGHCEILKNWLPLEQTSGTVVWQETP
jgi:ankyrin repeat protein